MFTNVDDSGILVMRAHLNEPVLQTQPVVYIHEYSA